MKIEDSGTKHDLIYAAGELFAEQGFEGTSIRAVAKKANANIAAVNYHFGSKENLYTEVLRYVMQRTVCQSKWIHSILDDPDLFQDREAIGEIIARIVREEFETNFSPDRPPWFAQVMIQSILRPSSSLSEIVNDYYKPDHDALKEFARKANPSLSNEEAELWVLSLKGQIAFYVIAQVGILLVRQEDHYGPAFLKAAAEYIARLATTALYSSDSRG